MISPARARSLSDGFLRSAQTHGDRAALEVAGETLTYSDLRRKAASIAATLIRHELAAGTSLTAVFAYRSVTAFAGVLAALMRGHGYVPLNRMFPAERTRMMLQRSGCRALIVDEQSADQLGKVLEDLEYPMLVVLPDRAHLSDLRARWPEHTFLGSRELVSHEEWHPPVLSPDAIAYLLFTSGSTGIPKGVMVAHRNVRHYIDFIVDRYSIHPEDRFSQTFDMTFDLSVADMFVAWERGACLCCPSEKVLLNPGRFIHDAGLTVWFSVPSTAVFMKRLGALKPGSYPRLRISLFCGEALPVEIADAWARAAPHSRLENLYGPTELTIACTCYRWDPARSPAEALHGIVPIGDPFPDMISLVADESLAEVGVDEEGELLMAGPQVSLGYWRDPQRTSAAFVKPPGRSELFYRTGDRVRKPSGAAPLLYLGRMDQQIKILGHRVELGEVEAVVREVSGLAAVVAVGWPKTPSGAGGVEVFLESDSPCEPGLKDKVARRLPPYMVPRRYHCLPQFPKNSNGKYDRLALTNSLQDSL